MPNSNLKDKLYNYGGEQLSYTALAMRESRLKKAKERCDQQHDCTEFNQLGGDNELKKLENIIHKEQKVDHDKKEVGMNAGRENEFIKKHDKDRDNANPTGVGGIPKVHKGGIKRKIMSNKEVYNENLKKEISEIRYLIEYMNNNKINKI